MPTVREALDRLYASAPAHEVVVSMREWLGQFHGDRGAAAMALAGVDKRSGKEYLAARRNVERYERWMAGDHSSTARNPDNVTRKILRRADTAEGRKEAKRRGVKVKRYKGKIKTSPKKRRTGKEGSFEHKDVNRDRDIRNVEIPGAALDSDALDGDTKAFSDAFLIAYKAGPIGELYDIEELELEFGDGRPSDMDDYEEEE